MVGWTRKKSDEQEPEAGPAPQVALSGDRVALIGRPQAGKSLVLAALLRQARNSIHSFAEHNPQFLPFKRKEDSRNDLGTMLDLTDRFVQGQPFPPTYTHVILDYLIRLECEGFEQSEARSFWSRFKRRAPERISADIWLSDAAGGLLFGSTEGNEQSRDERQRATEFAEVVRNARGLIYCLPATLTPTSLAADRKQMDIIVDLIMNDQTGLERIVVCMTKYEAVWDRYGSEAFDLAGDRDRFIDVARERIPEGLRTLLIDLARRNRRSPSGKPVEVCLTPASAFGFVKDNGCVNFNPATGRLLVEGGENIPRDMRSDVPLPFYSDLEAVNYWQPFYIVDPFIYAAFGEKGKLTIDVRELA